MNNMNKKKIIIASLVIFIVLVAIIALILKSRIKSGAIVPTSGKTISSDQAKTDASTTDVSNSESLISVPPVVEPIEVTDPSLNMMPGSPEAPRQEIVAADKVPAQSRSGSDSSLKFRRRQYSCIYFSQRFFNRTNDDGSER